LRQFVSQCLQHRAESRIDSTDCLDIGQNEQTYEKSAPFSSGMKLGPYEIIALLGAGGMGEVYRARDPRLDRDVAIKILPSGMLTDEVTRRQFRKEAMALAKLSHPNIAIIYDVGQEAGRDYLVMECVIGETLAEKLKSGPFDENHVVSIGVKIAEALEEAHEQGVVHRDLKPANIMVNGKGDIKVLDFGLAKLLVSTESFDESQSPAGTLPYMAPEQLRGESADIRTDIYGLGTVLFEMAIGAQIFQERLMIRFIDAILHQTPLLIRELKPGLSTELERIVAKTLAKDRDSRYQKASDLRADLARLMRENA
jgi:serine/threonine protein kinase